MFCQHCQGQGYAPNPITGNHTKCPYCNGTGTINSTGSGWTR